MRLLAIHTERDYDSRFGGLLYVFLRGVSQAGDGKSGFYFARPSWNEIVTYESDLLTREPDSELPALEREIRITRNGYRVATL